MAFSLYDATIPSYLQTIGAFAKLIDKAEAHCDAHDLAPEALIQARLAEDMLPFAFQAKWVGTHSLGAIESVRAGLCTPDASTPPDSFDGLRDILSRATEGLSAIEREEMERFIGKDMVFKFGETEIPFTAENFLLSFSLPNFYFHATTGYDILRAQGLEIGKLDFLGQLRMKMPG
ncbi:DUF1993 family protein [Parasphingopyxis sp.]|uniref:DUF1993 domain-containing protein n=1 Tax=Parasphingopyxis sp. TaxID=1920299 RepID=UPI00262CB19C|nr:DUF1993 domain-containing protein [Parasphingopyxis sp.]